MSHKRKLGEPLTLEHIPSSTVEPVITVKTTDSRERARTLMELHDFSQLPVVSGKGARPVGVVTWESIGRALIDNPGASLMDCAETKESIVMLKLDADLLTAIPIVNQRGFVLVVKDNGDLSGLVTSADLGDELARFAGPFLLLELLEVALRELVGSIRESGLADDTQLAEGLSSKGGKMLPEDVADMTLGDLKSIATHRSVWDSLPQKFDRIAMADGLGRAVTFRNQLMHFRDQEPDREQVMEELPRLTRMIKSLSENISVDQPTRDHEPS